jgi:hypothetical protein
MAAGYQDLYMEQGTTFTTQLTLTDSNGNPYQLSNFTIASQAKPSYTTTDANSILNFTSTTIDANNGILQLSATAANTANIVTNTVGKMVYDVIIIDTGGNVSRVLEGQIYVSPSVTNTYSSYIP